MKSSIRLFFARAARVALQAIDARRGSMRVEARRGPMRADEHRGKTKGPEQGPLKESMECKYVANVFLC
jgi:hypothetical protein